MIGAILHRLLHRSILRVPSENMGVMPLFSVSDIPFWVAFRGEWVKLIRKIAAFQKNLKTKEWSSLGVVYPRVGVLAYSFYLFCWAEYCDKTDEIFSRPDECLFAEVFLSYICQIDVMIDRRDTLHLWEGNHINAIKLDPKISITASELCARIKALPIERKQKHSLITQIANYRRNALKVMRRFASSRSQNLDEILDDKKATACDLLPEWSNLLNILYGISHDVSHGINQTFLNFSFLVQIIDDVADAASDYRNNVQNIFIAVIQQNEPEWIKMQTIINQNVQFTGWRWVRKNLPFSYQGIKHLYDVYADALQAERYKPHIARKMFSIIDGYRKLMELKQ